VENSALSGSDINGSGDDSFDYAVLINSLDEDTDDNDDIETSYFTSQLSQFSNSSLLDKVMLYWFEQGSFIWIFLM
jgi:hypothetical protein